ncbi:RICIN domain-containing protein [Streptomyces sp. tea 10]|nr:RICIN domain-containing protein [Streptomyces sp. tea 10]
MERVERCDARVVVVFEVRVTHQGHRVLLKSVAVASVAAVALCCQVAAAQAATPIAPPADQAVVIANASSGYYLSTDNQNENPNQDVEVWNQLPMNNGGSGAVWRLRHLGYGEYTIETETINSGERVCLTLPDTDARNHGHVMVRTCDSGRQSQQWRIFEDGETETYTITPANRAFTGFALAPQNYGSNSKVDLEEYWGSNAPALMRWQFGARHAGR